MFDFKVMHGPDGSTLAYLDVEKGPDQLTYTACFNMYDWVAPLHFSVETNIYDPFDDGELLIDDMPPGYSYRAHAQNVCWF